MSKIQSIGPYRIVQKIGKGGMGEIFLATKSGLNGEAHRRVAIKRLLEPFSDDDEQRALFAAELRLMAELHHPNIVQSYDSGEADGQFYLVMEYIAGIDANRLMRAYRSATQPIPLPVAVQIGVKAAAALDYVHSSHLSVVHRDISPSNILLGEQGEVKLTDFGIARFAGRNLGTMNVLKGKLGYMSPEQFGRPADLDHRSDLFSLGVVLYEMIAGTPAFRSRDGEPETIAETFQRVLRYSPRPLRELRPEVPVELESLLESMLHKERSARVQSAAEVVDRLLGLPYKHDAREIRRCVQQAREYHDASTTSRPAITLSPKSIVTPVVRDASCRGDEDSAQVHRTEDIASDSLHCVEPEPSELPRAGNAEDENRATLLFPTPNRRRATRELILPQSISARTSRTSVPETSLEQAGAISTEELAWDEVFRQEPRLVPQTARKARSLSVSEAPRRVIRTATHYLRSRPVISWATVSVSAVSLVLGLGLGEIHSAHSQGWRTPQDTQQSPGPLDVQSARVPLAIEPVVERILTERSSPPPQVLVDYAVPAISEVAPPQAARPSVQTRAQSGGRPLALRNSAHTAHANITIAPWGHVWVDGVLIGVAPVRVDVAPGRHRIDVGQGAPSQRKLVVLSEGNHEYAFDL